MPIPKVQNREYSFGSARNQHLRKPWQKIQNPWGFNLDLGRYWRPIIFVNWFQCHLRAPQEFLSCEDHTVLIGESPRILENSTKISRSFSVPHFLSQLLFFLTDSQHAATWEMLRRWPCSRLPRLCHCSPRLFQHIQPHRSTIQQARYQTWPCKTHHTATPTLCSSDTEEWKL